MTPTARLPTLQAKVWMNGVRKKTSIAHRESRLMHSLATLTLVTISFACGLHTCSRAFGSDSSRLTNVIVILTGDQSYGDVGVHGNRLINIPHPGRIRTSNWQGNA